ncbi:hypothetical protein [Listeria innocua]|uniref:hypothetical protein n=1 Tax=Listeria innocua TaxID=1642 RepID=UPI0016259307|nr:hypothetical protein [Listeria innocua]MBC1925561.1 hypothetical protein [Listeria innocua]
MRKWLNSFFDKRRLKRRKGRFNPSRFYKIAMGLTVFLALFFALPSLYLGTEDDQSDTPPSATYTLNFGGVNFRVVGRNYNDEAQYLEVFLQADKDLPVGGKVEMLAGETKTKQVLRSKVVPLTEHYLLLQVHEIPKNFRQIVLDVGIETRAVSSLTTLDIERFLSPSKEEKSKKATEISQTTLFVARSKIKSSEGVKPENIQKYLIEALDLEVIRAQEFVVGNLKNIKIWQKELPLKDKQIKQIEQEQVYQTTTEKEKSNQAIHDLKQEKESMQVKIKEAEHANIELEEKINKLKLKQADVINGGEKGHEK